MTSLLSTDAEIDRIGRGLLDRSLAKSEWTHAAHFAVVLWLLRHLGKPEVMVAMPKLIRSYNETSGVANTDTSGYHETITIASIRAADNALDAHSVSVPLHEILSLLLTSELGRSGWPLRYWSRPRLFSPEARRQWLDPDVAPFPY